MKRFALFATTALLAVTAMAESSSVWGGYYDGTSTRSSVGTKSKAVYNIASYYGAGLSGQTIDSVSIYFRSMTCLKDIKLWVSTTLPASAEEADICCKVLSRGELAAGDPDGNIGAQNIIGLDTPYTITSQGVYVGYTFTVSSISNQQGQYPVPVGPNKTDNALWLKLGTQGWEEYGSSLGVLAMQLKLSGEKPLNAVTPFDLPSTMAGLNEERPVILSLQNVGTAAVTSIDYTITTDGVASEEKHLDFSPAIANYAACTSVQIMLSGDDVQGSKTKTLTVTKVNGQDNEAAVKESKALMVTIQETFPHRVVVEEYTGTGCGYCPRGLQGMENLRQQFGDNFIGIGLHMYNTGDPMYPANYATLSFSGAPSCMIERMGEADPYWGAQGYGVAYDICDDVKAAMEELAVVGVEVNGAWTEDKKSVVASATVTPIYPDGNYHVEFVLVADDVKGTSTAWRQANYYYQYTNPSQGYCRSDMAKFCSGGQYGSSYVTGWAFNDVCIASSCKSSVNMAPEITLNGSFVPVNCNYTIAMPTKTALLNGLNYEKIYVVALVVDDKTGYVVNGAKSLVSGTAGIQQIEADETDSASCFDLQGRQISTPRQGEIFIQNGEKKIIR